jgi:hypothetical protein
MNYFIFWNSRKFIILILNLFNMINDPATSQDKYFDNKGNQVDASRIKNADVVLVHFSASWWGAC